MSNCALTKGEEVPLGYIFLVNMGSQCKIVQVTKCECIGSYTLCLLLPIITLFVLLYLVVDRFINYVSYCHFFEVSLLWITL